MVPPSRLCQRARAQLIPRRRSSVGAQRSGVEDVTRSGSSLGCVAHFNRHLPGADTLGPPSPEPSNHQRKPLRWPPIPHDEAATRPALDPPANMAAATDDQVLIAHRAPFRLVLKCDGTVVRVTVSWWRDRPQEPATNIGGQAGQRHAPVGGSSEIHSLRRHENPGSTVGRTYCPNRAHTASKAGSTERRGADRQICIVATSRIAPGTSEHDAPRGPAAPGRRLRAPSCTCACWPVRHSSRCRDPHVDRCACRPTRARRRAAPDRCEARLVEASEVTGAQMAQDDRRVSVDAGFLPVIARQCLRA